jgi:RNA polymerase sigma factor, sigma-70 family
MMIFLAMLDTLEEKEVFMALYDKYKYFIWYIANGILKDTQLAEDVVQEVMLALIKHIDKIEVVESGQTKKFIMTVTKNKAVDLIRKKSNTKHEEWEDNVSNNLEKGPDLLEQYITNDNYKYIVECIGELNEIYKVVFEYKYLHQLSDGEIADLLQVTKKVVNVRIYRARKQLQELLERRHTVYE